ncbi:MAG: hypothetical protein GKR94_06690 [Gammaproteobacteria bacterium]|nr:hypothetical protein [Gammaproteobacteria bacterium]
MGFAPTAFKPWAPHRQRLPVIQHSKFEQPSLIVLGDERKGLSAKLKHLCATFATIPMAASIDSLTVAGGLPRYEMVRASTRH